MGSSFSTEGYKPTILAKDDRLMHGGRAAEVLTNINPNTFPSEIQIYQPKKVLPSQMYYGIVSKTLSNQQINEFQSGILTILDLNRLKLTTFSKNKLESIFQNMTDEEIEENSKQLIEYKIIPPLEFVDDTTTGGEDQSPEKRKRTPSTFGPEFTSPEKISEYRKSIKTEQKQYELEQQEKYRKSLEGRPIFDLIGETQTFDTLDPYLQQLDVCQTRSASKLMNTIFPPIAVEEWTKVLGKKCRDIYEWTDPTTQCSSVLSPPPFNRKTDKCYICGFGFYEEKIDELEPVCEHILPIIQAIFFLDLYRKEDKGRLTPEQLEVLKKEYAWAHWCCNSIKDDFSFIATKIGKKNRYPTWGFSVNETTKILKTILNSKTRKGVDIIRNQISDKDKWFSTQKNKIRDEKITPIIEYINSRGNGGTIMMIGLRNCLDSSKINEKFRIILSNLENNQPPSAKKRRIGGDL